MTFFGKLVAILIIVVVMVLLLATFYSDEGLFTKIKDKVVGVGDNVPGLETTEDTTEQNNGEENEVP